MKIDIMKHEIFTQNIKTFKEVSKDKSNDEYMTDSDIRVIDFDNVKTEYTNKCQTSEESAKSVDAFTVLDDTILLVEFKNGDMKNQNQDVKFKILHSLLILCDILKCNISDIRGEWVFILVYNEEKNLSHNKAEKSLIEIAKHCHEKANESFVRFDLEKFKKIYFKDVYTYSQKEFDDFLSEHNEAGCAF